MRAREQIARRQARAFKVAMRDAPAIRHAWYQPDAAEQRMDEQLAVRDQLAGRGDERIPAGGSAWTN